MANILYLSLKKEWFDKIYSGEKIVEYRENKPYWQNRLIDKNYDFVVIRNGYGNSKPVIVSMYEGFILEECKNDLGILNEPVFKIPVGNYVYRSKKPHLEKFDLKHHSEIVLTSDFVFCLKNYTDTMLIKESLVYS